MSVSTSKCRRILVCIVTLSALVAAGYPSFAVKAFAQSGATARSPSNASTVVPKGREAAPQEPQWGLTAAQLSLSSSYQRLVLARYGDRRNQIVAAAKAGDPIAAILVADAVAEEEDDPIPPRELAMVLENAAQSGIAAATPSWVNNEVRARNLDSFNDLPAPVKLKAEQLLRRATANGDPGSMVFLALSIWAKQSFEMEDNEAEKLIERAARLNFAAAYAARAVMAISDIDVDDEENQRRIAARMDADGRRFIELDPNGLEARKWRKSLKLPEAPRPRLVRQEEPATPKTLPHASAAWGLLDDDFLALSDEDLARKSSAASRRARIEAASRSGDPVAIVLRGTFFEDSCPDDYWDQVQAAKSSISQVEARLIWIRALCTLARYLKASSIGPELSEAAAADWMARYNDYLNEATIEGVRPARTRYAQFNLMDDNAEVRERALIYARVDLESGNEDTMKALALFHLAPCFGHFDPDQARALFNQNSMLESGVRLSDADFNTYLTSTPKIYCAEAK
jgi:hypothetical protein